MQRAEGRECTWCDEYTVVQSTWGSLESSQSSGSRYLTAPETISITSGDVPPPHRNLRGYTTFAGPWLSLQCLCHRLASFPLLSSFTPRCCCRITGELLFWLLLLWFLSPAVVAVSTVTTTAVVVTPLLFEALDPRMRLFQVAGCG